MRIRAVMGMTGLSKRGLKQETWKRKEWRLSSGA